MPVSGQSSHLIPPENKEHKWFSGVFKGYKMEKISQKSRGGSRAAARSKMERFVIIVIDFQLLTIITKRSIFDVTAVLDLPLKKVKLVSTVACSQSNKLA